MQKGFAVKSASIPPVRVSQELRQAAEALLSPDETLSGFVEEAVRRNVDFRRAQQDFVTRGLASAAKAKDEGGYISAAAVIGKLSRRIAKAKKRIGAE